MCFDVVTFLGEDSEVVNLCYDRFIAQVFGTPIDYEVVSVFGSENVQVLLGVDGSSCESEEGSGIE